MSLAALPAMKKCGRCQRVKSSSEFSRCRSRGDGLHTRCKACAREHYQSRREDALRTMKAYRERNRDQLLAKHREYWRATNDERLAKQREYHDTNRKAIRAQQREYRQRNKELISRKNREQYLKNKPARNEYSKQWNADRRRNDPLFKLKSNMRTRTNDAIRRGGFTKLSGMNDAIGCDWPTLQSHLQSHFAPWMTWENYGSHWVVDHHVPLASASNSEEVLRLCHYTNLRPLGKTENLRKAAKVPPVEGAG